LSNAIDTARQTKRNAVKDQPLWAVPFVLAILMLSSAGMFVLIAIGVSIMSGVGY
jgi:hypothetical protein